MANIILTNPKFFKGGESGASYVVGFDSGVNRVVRYSFEPPSIGANKIELSFLRNWTGGGTLPNTLRFFVGTDPNSHINAGVGYEYTGELARKQGTYEYYGSADIVILPNRTYYVFVFPTTQTYGWVQWSNSEGDATAETFGGAFSVVSPQSLTIGEPSTILVTKYNEPYTHTIRYSIGTASGVICEKASATEITWTPSVDLARQITDSETGLATLTVESYSGDALIGTAPGVQFTLKVPEYMVPSVTAAVEDLSSGFDLFGVFVQNISFLKVNYDAVGAYGSGIKSVVVYLGGNIYNGGVVTESGETLLSVVATDTRGRTGKHDQTIFFHEYYAPTISVSASRCDENGNPDETGEFATIKMVAKTYQVNDRNTAKITLSYGNSSKEISVQVGETVVYEKASAPSVSSLRISAVLIDRVSQSMPSTMVLGVGYATMDFLAGGKGIAFGTTALNEGFTCAMPSVFTGGVTQSVKQLYFNNDTDGSLLHSALDSVLSPMGYLTARTIAISDYPYTSGQTYFGYVYKYDNEYAIVIVCSYGSFGSMAIKTKNGGAWSEWSWLNPAMGIGTEYRTSERYNGKPVYMKIINCGSGPNNAEKKISHGANNAIVFDYGGYMSSESGTLSIPWYDYSEIYASSTEIIIKTHADYSSYNAYAWIKYYKTTD